MSTLKRFRPSTKSICSHLHCVEAASSVLCAYCPLIFCLQHLVEHQIAIDNEHTYLISAVENCRTRLKTLQFNDNRSELFQQLNQWQKTMIENVEIMKKEIYLTHEEYNQEFNRRKKNLLNNDNDDEKNLKEVRSINN
ncbi:unnamed protein product [Rotaria sp. Silwood2]|nr:unnamed protein product [Rotaria sp. Silwood2]